MEISEWRPWYDRIASAFRFSRFEDQHATDILSELIRSSCIDPSDVKVAIVDRPILIFGAGPSLEEDASKIKKAGLLERFAIITADGATSALLEIVSKVPHIIVTDLDGRFEDLLSANRRGSIMVVHSHGDNIPQLLEYVPKLTNILGTTQVEPRPRVYNFGGFTDGDRAAFLALVMGAKAIALAGMDLGKTIGKYSKKYIASPERKLLKLRFCKKLLESLASKTSIDLYNLTSHGEKIKGFRDIDPVELMHHIQQ